MQLREVAEEEPKILFKNLWTQNCFLHNSSLFFCLLGRWTGQPVRVRQRSSYRGPRLHGMNTDMKQDVSESMPAKCRQTVINTRQCVRPAVSQCAKLRTKMTEFQQHRISQDQNRWALINLACPLHHLMRRFYIETCLSGPYFNVQNPTDNMVGEVEPSEGLQALATQAASTKAWASLSVWP